MKIICSKCKRDVTQEKYYATSYADGSFAGYTCDKCVMDFIKNHNYNDPSETLRR